MNDRKIERSNGRGFGRLPLANWTQFHRKFHFAWKKEKVTRCGPKFTIYKPSNSFWLSNWVSLFSPSDPHKLYRSRAPRARPFILQSKLSITFWFGLREWLPDDWQGLELGFELELCRLTNGLKRFYLPPSPWINCVEFEFFLGPLKTSKSRTAVSRYQPSSTRLTRYHVLIQEREG